MNSPLSTLTEHHTEKLVAKKQALAALMFNSLIQADRYVGEVFSVGFNEFIAQVHDSFRRDVGGIPQGAFLIATRVSPDQSALPFDDEDSEIVLLRVMGPTSLPRDGERQDQRADAVARAMQGDSAWETEVDEYTHNNLSFSGLRCRVLGTLYIEESATAPDGLQLRLGTDIDNFYSGRGMKIYKPSADALKQLVNYRDPEFRSDHPLGDHTVSIASLRYGSTRRNLSSDGVDISITPADLIGQKTALFGMTRSGKSNTTKIIAQAIYELRAMPVPTDASDTPEQAAARAKSNRIGQLIFDPNGEYANENVQDGTNLNPSALKNIHRHLGLTKAAEVVTYGTLPHPKDPDRRLMKINVFGDQLAMTDMLGIKTAEKSGVASNIQKAQEDAYTVLQEKTQMLLIGKAILNELLAPSKETKYIGNFIGTDLAPPDLTMFPPDEAYGRGVRYIRSLLVYRALLAEGGLDAPFRPSTKNLFSKELRDAMRTPLDPKEAALQQEFEEAADILDPKVTPSPSWNDLAIAFKGLDKFLERPEYADFNRKYREDHEGRSWHDSTL
ncbi:hypothetical protein Dcar01_01805 [Deinococcus carri]|uniref:Helicase HerA central domain-containing protein n=1 Tax=Deinococcus carri TaxID=1211323 RepID=A0ABP9W6Z1_9DEIO